MVTQTESGPWRQRVRAENETFVRRTTLRLVVQDRQSSLSLILPPSPSPRLPSQSRSFDTRDKYKQVAPGSQAAVSAAYNGFVHHGTGTPEPPPVTATHLDLTRLYVSRVNNFAYKDLRLPHNSAHAPAPLASPSAAAAVAANAAPALHQTAAPLPLAAAPASAAPSAAAAPTPIAPVTAAAASQSPSPVPAPSQATARGAARRVAF